MMSTFIVMFDETLTIIIFVVNTFEFEKTSQFLRNKILLLQVLIDFYKAHNLK